MPLPYSYILGVRCRAAHGAQCLLMRFLSGGISSFAGIGDLPVRGPWGPGPVGPLGEGSRRAHGLSPSQEKAATRLPVLPRGPPPRGRGTSAIAQGEGDGRLISFRPAERRVTPPGGGGGALPGLGQPCFERAVGLELSRNRCQP